MAGEQNEQRDDRAIGAHAAAGQCQDGRYELPAAGSPAATDPQVAAWFEWHMNGCRGCGDQPLDDVR